MQGGHVGLLFLTMNCLSFVYYKKRVIIAKEDIANKTTIQTLRKGTYATTIWRNNISYSKL